MHISFLTSEYPHPKTKDGGGIGTSIKNLASALCSKGEQITVFVYGANNDEIFYDNKIRVINIPYKKYLVASSFLYRKNIQNIINKYIEANQIDCIEAPDWTGITAFMKLRCPVIIKFHGSDTYFCRLEKRKQKWKNYFFEKTAIKQANAYIGVSQFVLMQSMKMFKIKRTVPTSVIYNGIDIKKFECQEKEYIEEPILLYIGTLIRKKGVLELPFIFNLVNEKIPNASLLLIGADSRDIVSNNNSTWEMMQKCFTEKAMKQVKYIGKLPYEEVVDYLRKDAICIFPSYAEAFPISWLEAMSMRNALVTSDIGWANESVEKGISGITVAPDNHEEYAKTIVDIIKNKELRKRLACAARERVEQNFSSEIIAEKSSKFYMTVKQQYIY